MIKKKNLYAGIVYDTLRQMGYKDEEVLLSGIKSLNNSSVVYGPAFTNKGRLVKKGEDYSRLDEIRLEMYKKIKKGDVIVLSANDDYCAHAGDITCMIYKKLGSEGFITDGNVRDKRIIKKSGYPCFCGGVNPIDALDYWAITEFQKPVFFSSVSGKEIEIRPRDYIFADSDGIMVIPSNKKKEFEKKIAANIKRENTCRKRIINVKARNEVYLEVEKIFKKYGRW